MNFIKKEYRNGYERKFFLGIRYSKKKTFARLICEKLKNKRNFDCSDLDNEIAGVASSIQVENIDTNLSANRVAFIATEFYDFGGHTEEAKNLIQILSTNYTIKTFFSKLQNTYNQCKNKIKLIKQYSDISGIDSDLQDFTESVKSLYEQIVTFHAKILCVFIHMDDVVWTAVLSLLRNNTSIKILYFNHGTHYPALGFSFAHLVMEEMPITQWVTQKYRSVNNCYILGLPDIKKESISKISKERYFNIRETIGIPQNAILTMTGCNSYKLFNNDGTSNYFMLIKEMLERRPNVYHCLITQLSKEQYKIVRKVFNGSSCFCRLKLIDYRTDYLDYYQCCDFFIDSFPMSSAMSQVDLMKYAKASVVHINNQNYILDFHELFPKDYPYQFEDYTSMLNGIIELVDNQDVLSNAGNILYEHYLNNYEGSVILKKMKNIIDNADQCESFARKLPDNLSYKVKFRWFEN